MQHRLKLLFVSDLYYPAKGRVYRNEDLFVVDQLRGRFEIALCQPTHAISFLDAADVVVVRNTGPVLHYREEYHAFREAAAARNMCVYNPLTGKGDMQAKQHLLDLFVAGYPVIPTVDRVDDLDRLGPSKRLVVKRHDGSDSIGMFTEDREEVMGRSLENMLVQPFVAFDYEVSFYFVDHEFHYALYTPDSTKRWELVRYEPTADDLAFAQRFIEWNDLSHGIQRVDACRVSATGELLLVELEDHNPYLSLDALSNDERVHFIDRMAASIAAWHEVWLDRVGR